MSIKKLHYFLVICVLLSIISMCGCEVIKQSTASKEQTIKDIAFDRNKKSGYTLYIEEDSKYIPYLVLTANYNDHALLLRRDVLDKDHIYNDNANDYSSYYKDSLIDRFLNNDFISILSPEMQKAIIDSEIIITTESSLFSVETDVEKITRKVFLLSCTEVGLSNISFLGKEGEPLKYFKDADSRRVYKNEDKWNWWLRTPCLGTGSSMMMWIIRPKGTFDMQGVAGFFPENGVRPAFCLRNTLLIEKSNKVINGQTVYIVAK